MENFRIDKIQPFIDGFLKDVDQNKPFVFKDREGIERLLPVERVISAFQQAYELGYHDAMVDVIDIQEKLSKIIHKYN